MGRKEILERKISELKESKKEILELENLKDDIPEGHPMARFHHFRLMKLTELQRIIFSHFRSTASVIADQITILERKLSDLDPGR